MSTRREGGGPVRVGGAAGDALDTERASASPRGSPAEAPPRPAAPERAPVRAVEAPLATIEAWLAAVTTDPRGLQAGLTNAAPIAAELGAPCLEAIVRPGPHLGAEERLAIYHHAYHARLVDCVKDDFDGVGRALGEQTFDRVCHAYVRAHPSRSPNLNVYAERFVDFVAGLDDRGFDPRLIAELARLEWAMIEVRHAPATPRIDLGALAAAPPEAWAGARLWASPSLRVLRFAYPVNAWYAARLEGPAPAPRPSPSVTAVFRDDWRIWRMDLPPSPARVLDALLAGRPLGEALSALDPDLAGGADVQRWFQEWLSSGFFCRLEL